MTAPQHALERTMPAWTIWTAVAVSAVLMAGTLLLALHRPPACDVTITRTGARWTGADPRNITPWPPDCTLRWAPEGAR